MDLTKKQQIAAIKTELRPLIKDIRTAEAVLHAAQTGASVMIGKLIKTAENPGPHKLRIDGETVVLLTFRKIGDHVDPTTNKTVPTYGMRETDLSDEDEG